MALSSLSLQFVYSHRTPTVNRFASMRTRSVRLMTDQASTKDAHSYPDLVSTFARIGRALAPLLRMTPPDIDKLSKESFGISASSVWRFVVLVRRTNIVCCAMVQWRWPNLAAEWFETELLRATIAARGNFRGVCRAMVGRNQRGPAAASGTDEHTIQPRHSSKRMGALSQALSKVAADAGAEIRTNAEVASVSVKDGKAVGVVLTSGEEITGRAVISNADPRTTFLKLVDPAEFDPSVLNKIRNYRAKGTAAKVHLALSALPQFSSLSNGDSNEKLSGTFTSADIDYLEHAFDAAKYGDMSPHPYLDITIPFSQRSDAGGGRSTCDVDSRSSSLRII